MGWIQIIMKKMKTLWPWHIDLSWNFMVHRDRNIASSNCFMLRLDWKDFKKKDCSNTFQPSCHGRCPTKALILQGVVRNKLVNTRRNTDYQWLLIIASTALSISFGSRACFIASRTQSHFDAFGMTQAVAGSEASISEKPQRRQRRLQRPPPPGPLLLPRLRQPQLPPQPLQPQRPQDLPQAC